MAISTTLAGLIALVAAALPAAGQRPNVLLVMTDDQRIGVNA